MKVIELTKGFVTVVDDEDFDRIAQYRWHWSTGYAARNSKGVSPRRIIKMHWEIIGKPPKGMDVDHINCDKLDNRRCNLRFATRSQNKMNCPVRKNNKHQAKGVFWNSTKERFQASITLNGKQKLLGYFDDVESAKTAYNSAALEIFGSFARINA